MIANEKAKQKEQLEQMKQNKRRSRNLHQLRTFKMHITPREYRGMSFLGSYPDNIGKVGEPIETLKDPRLAHLDLNVFRNRSVLEVGAGNGNVAMEVASRMAPSKFTALEIDPRLVQIAQKRVNESISKR